MITGETGTGKTLIAKYIHNLSPRKSEPFADINCGGIPESLLEAELFGFVKGAFTGAPNSRKGLIRSANKGTIFLDEIGNMPISIQSKLLKFLDTKQIQPLGSDTIHEVDVRIISATNIDILKAIKEQNFRLDLYHRLNVINIQTIPLRKNKLDVGLLCQYYLNQINKELGTNINYIDNEVFDIFQSFNWSGNIRELCNVLYNSVILHKKEDDELHKEDLPRYMIDDIEDLIVEKSELLIVENPVSKDSKKKFDHLKPKDLNLSAKNYTSYQNFKEQADMNFLKNSLIEFEGNVSELARALKVNRMTVIQKIKKYDLAALKNKKERINKDQEKDQNKEELSDES
jgi:transcriptional regulator with PAS, ATPase and Fis domain